MQSEGIKIFSLQDKDADGNALELEEIDPFTFLAAFNRGITAENRQAVLRRFKEHFALTSDIPKDFEGIPVVMNFNAWFFSYKSKRKTDDIEKLWKLHEILVRENRLDEESSTGVLNIHMLNIPKLTVGLYWSSPKSMLPYDSRTQKYLADQGIHLNKPGLSRLFSTY